MQKCTVLDEIVCNVSLQGLKICQTRGRAFHSDFRTPRSRLKEKNKVQPNPLRGVWKDETLFRVFNLASEIDRKRRGKKRTKIA